MPGTGTVTLLFTDLVGSTELLVALGEDRFDSVRDEHDVLVGGTIAAYHGEVVKHTGDGYMAAFSRAADAVGAAAETQRLAAARNEASEVALGIRIGISAGDVIERAGDYHGLAVVEAARLCAAAAGGQILASETVRSLVGSRGGHDFVALGEVDLKGLPPLPAVAVRWCDDAPVFAPSGSAKRSLPASVDRFIGRQHDLDAIRALVGERRLVTLTGPGGSGKTRLAIEVADSLNGTFPDGVRFADLAAVTDEARVVDAVVTALRLAPDPTVDDPLARVAAYLADRAVLCVLDNCEHLLDACAELTKAVITRPGSSRLLATSREALGVVGEQVYLVPPLDAETDAVRLFADRAAEARTGFAVDANRATIVEICRRLDGMPLAIELAAARIAHLSPAQVLEFLDDRFRLLTRGRRVPRHQTLTATLDWSHDLLEPREQVVLRRLAAFPASFTLEAAESVADVDDVLEPLGSLVAKSLVQVVDEGERLRYRLLETVRLYAEAKLVGAGEADWARARQRDWVLDWLEAIPLEERWFGDADILTAEHANVRAALEWSVLQPDAEAAARIAAGVNWTRGEHWRDGVRWCEAAASTADALPPELQAQLYIVLWQLGRMTVRGSADWTRRDDWAQRAIDASRGQPSPLHAFALVVRAMGAAIRASELQDASLARQSTDWAEASVAMSEQFPAPWQMYCRLSAGGIYTTQALWLGNPEPAERHYTAGIDAAPAGRPYLGLRATLRGALALRRLVDGDTSGALVLARDAQVDVAVLPVVGREDPPALSLVVALGATGDSNAAVRGLRAYNEAVTRVDWSLGRETVVLYGGVLAALREDWETAARLLAAGARSRYRAAATALLYQTFDGRVRAALGVERFEQLQEEGRAMPLADALDAALAG